MNANVLQTRRFERSVKLTAKSGPIIRVSLRCAEYKPKRVPLCRLAMPQKRCLKCRDHVDFSDGLLGFGTSKNPTFIGHAVFILAPMKYISLD